MIETISLSKTYNVGKTNEVVAVSDVNIKAENGKITALTGPSGCGKTTLMSMMGLLLTPSKGKVLYDGEDVTALSDGWKAVFRRNNIGFVFQHINLLSNLNALDNVMMPLLSHDVDPADYKDDALALLDKLGLSQRASFNVEQLSGGQQQRVAVARALITNPKVIVADEPLTFVDLDSAKAITAFFEVMRSEGKTVLLSTHSRELVNIADVTYSIRDGIIVGNN